MVAIIDSGEKVLIKLRNKFLININLILILFFWMIWNIN